VLGQSRIEHKSNISLGPFDVGGEQLIQTGLQCEGVHDSLFGFVLGDKIHTKPASDLFRKFIRVLGERREIRNRFEYDIEVSDGNALFEKVFEHSLDQSHGHQIRK